MSIKKVAMIILMQQDVDAAVTFYKRLGLTLVFHIKGRWAEFDVQGVKIGLCPTDKTITDYRTGLVLEVADIATFYASLTGQVTFLGEPTGAAQGSMVSVKDPGGNIIDLYQPLPSKAQVLYGDMAHQANRQGCCTTEKIEKAEGCCKVEQKCC